MYDAEVLAVRYWTYVLEEYMSWCVELYPQSRKHWDRMMLSMLRKLKLLDKGQSGNLFSLPVVLDGGQ